MIQDNTVESTIEELHGYEPILLKRQLQKNVLLLLKARTASIPRPRTKAVEGVVVAVVVMVRSSRLDPSATTVVNITTVSVTNLQKPPSLTD